MEFRHDIANKCLFLYFIIMYIFPPSIQYYTMTLYDMRDSKPNKREPFPQFLAKNVFIKNKMM